MKKMYIGALATICLLFFATYTVSQHAKEGSEKTTQATVEVELATETSEAPQPVVRVEEPFATTKMRYVRIVENEMTGTEEWLEEAMPAVLVGLKRNEIIDYLQAQTQDSYGEREAQERIHYELISFSSQGLTVKETISANPAAYECFIIAEGEFVNIYTADRTSLYLDTMLYRDDFSEEVQEDLTRGIYMPTIMDLYDFLQNTTS